MRRISGLIVVLALGGCSVGTILDPPTSVDAFGQGPPITQRNYREVVAKSGFVIAMRSNSAFGPLEISGFRKAIAPQLREWITCLRTVEARRTLYFGVFMNDRSVIEARQGVAIDRCEQQEYSLLPK